MELGVSPKHGMSDPSQVNQGYREKYGSKEHQGHFFLQQVAKSCQKLPKVAKSYEKLQKVAKSFQKFPKVAKGCQK